MSIEIFFELSKEDSKKMEEFFYPIGVPLWLTKEQVSLCLELHGKIWPKKVLMAKGMFFELWSAAKTLTVTDRKLSLCFSELYKKKMSVAKTFNTKEWDDVSYHLQQAENLPEWQQDEYLRKHLPGFYE